MIYEVIKKNKGIVISGILFVLLSACCGCNCYYKGEMTRTAYVVRMIVCIVGGIWTFTLACKYKRKVILKYGWAFIIVGMVAAFYSIDNNMSFLGIDIMPLINTIAVLGLALHFYQYSVKSISHTALFWFLGFLFPLAVEKEYFVIVLTVMVGFMLACAYKNKLIEKRAIWILNLVLYAVLLAWTVQIIAMGIVEFKNMFYDTGYMAAISRQILANLKIFGTSEWALPFNGDSDDFKLLWIFGVNGIAAGVSVLVSLTAFIFFVCKKSFKITLTDTTPIAYATASTLVVRYVISMFTNFGMVLGSLYAPIPFLSDGVFGYVAIFASLGLLLGEEKGTIKANADNKAKKWIKDDNLSDLFEIFFEGLILSVSKYNYEPTKLIDVLSFDNDNYTFKFDGGFEQIGMQGTHNEYMPDVNEIVKRQYEAVEKYCNNYFAKLKAKFPGNKYTIEMTKEKIDNLLALTERLVSWDTNTFHVEREIRENKLLCIVPNNAVIFETYKQVADDLTKSMFEEDKKHIALCWIRAMRYLK